MKNQLVKKTCIIIAATIGVVMAIQPNYVETTTFDVDKAGNDLVVIEYSDGLGRSIQSKVKLADDTDRVTCTFYDEAGRPKYATKSFVDIKEPGTYLTGEISDNGAPDNDVEQQLLDLYSDSRAFSETKYWNDPLGKVRTAIGPGNIAMFGVVKNWNIGVGLNVIDPLPITSGGATIGAVAFNKGMITSLTSSTTLVALLDALYVQFLTDNPFEEPGVSTPTHFLTISMSTDNKISMELKDTFGRKIRTLSAPDTNGITGLKIISEYSHDIFGNVLTATPPTGDGGMKLVDGNECIYNTLGQLIWKKSPDISGEYTYRYYDNGLLERSMLNIDGFIFQILNYSYDNLGRKTMIQEMGTPNPFPAVRYYYDDLTSIPLATFYEIPAYVLEQFTNLKGRLVATVTTNWWRQRQQPVDIGELYSYDDEGRIARKILVISGSPLFQETVYTYDIHGKDTAQYFYYADDHFRKRYEYDKLGRLVKVFNGIPQAGGTYNETELVHNAFNQVGQMEAETLSAITGGSYAVTFGYDIKDRLRSSTTDPNGPGFSQTINYFERSDNIFNSIYTYKYLDGVLLTEAYNSHYMYDDVNRLDEVSTEHNSKTTTNVYGYDQAGRFKYKQEGATNLTDYNYYSAPAATTPRYTSRLKKTSKNPYPSDNSEYVYDKRGNLIVDFLKKMVVEYDWRDLPVMYCFYDDLLDAGITKDATGTCTNSDLYQEINDKVTAGTVVLVSTVMMVYDANGNRVCKMENKE